MLLWTVKFVNNAQMQLEMENSNEKGIITFRLVLTLSTLTFEH